MAPNSSTLLSVSLLTLLGSPLVAQEIDVAQQYRDTRAAIATARDALLKDLTVNGKPLDPVELKQSLIHILASPKVNTKILDIIVTDYLQDSIDNGRDPSEFEVTEEEVLSTVEDFIAEAKKKDPDIDVWDAILVAFNLDKQQFMDRARQTKVFDKVFFPGTIENWPVITREAVINSSPQNGQQFWDAMVTQLKGKEMPAFYMGMCRQWVQYSLRQWSIVEFPADGLPPELCVRVNDRGWDTEEAFEEVMQNVPVQSIQNGITEVVITKLLEAQLEAKGVLMPADEFRARYDEHRAQYEGSPFNLEVIATTYKGYPSEQVYRNRWRLIQSYQDMIADTIDDDALRNYGKKHVRFFQDSRTNVDVIPFVAKDLVNGAWIEGGFEQARTRAEQTMKDIEAGGNFDELLKERGEFSRNDELKGRLGAQSLNKLRKTVGESEYSDLHQGYSVGEFLYYEAVPGKIYGPLRTPSGYYIARVNSRVPASGTPDISSERVRNLVMQDMVQARFLEYANELLADSDFR